MPGRGRRRFLAALAAGLVVCVPAAAAAQSATPVLVISQERILREARAPAALGEREQAEMLALQGDIDARRVALQDEEAELARLRETLPRDEFEARASDFDTRMRAARRTAQERVAALQARFRIARERLVRYLPPILAEIAEARGAQLVIDASTVLIASPAIDVTDQVIAELDRRIDAAALEALLPAEAPAPGTAPPGPEPGDAPEPEPEQ